jgi:hypothetical protein
MGDRHLCKRNNAALCSHAISCSTCAYYPFDFYASTPSFCFRLSVFYCNINFCRKPHSLLFMLHTFAPAFLRLCSFSLPHRFIPLWHRVVGQTVICASEIMLHLLPIPFTLSHPSSAPITLLIRVFLPVRFTSMGILETVKEQHTSAQQRRTLRRVQFYRRSPTIATPRTNVDHFHGISFTCYCFNITIGRVEVLLLSISYLVTVVTVILIFLYSFWTAPR